MRLTTILAASLALAACAPAEQPAEEDMAPAAEMQAMATVATFAGGWAGEATVDGTPDPVPYEMMVVPDGSSTMNLTDRPDIPLSLSMSGDSLIAVTAQYESVLRDGVMVVLRVASVLRDDMLQGNMVATYSAPDGQEVVTGTTTGRRSP